MGDWTKERELARELCEDWGQQWRQSIYEDEDGIGTIQLRITGVRVPVVHGKTLADVIAAAGPALFRALNEIEQQKERSGSLFDAIAHGDDEHRAWLKKAVEDHFAGRPVQRPEAIR